MTNEQAKDLIQILRDALEECLAAYRATNRTPETTMKAEAQLDRIRTANEQANEALAATESATAAPIAAGVVPEGPDAASGEAFVWDYEIMGVPNEEVAEMWTASGHSGVVPFSFANRVQERMRLAAPAHPVAGAAVALTDGRLLQIAADCDYGDEDPKCILRLARAILAATPAPVYWQGEVMTTNRMIEVVKEWAAKAWDEGSAAPASPAVAPSIPEAGAETEAARDVLAERQRQKGVEGWTPEHDDQYQGDELSLAAACYAMASDVALLLETPNLWPWAENWWKPTTERRNLVKAGALILAEIERLDRLATKEPV